MVLCTSFCQGLLTYSKAFSSIPGVYHPEAMISLLVSAPAVRTLEQLLNCIVGRGKEDRFEHLRRRISEKWCDQSDEKEGGDQMRGWVSNRKIFGWWWRKSGLVGKDACVVYAHGGRLRDPTGGDWSKNCISSLEYRKENCFDRHLTVHEW